MSQATRCWAIYSTTESLNAQWQAALAALNSVFQNYMLIGTQWGGAVEPEPPNPVPDNAVPGMLSNITHLHSELHRQLLPAVKDHTEYGYIFLG
jgi:hypothetical protein